MLKEIRKCLNERASATDAEFLQRYFKTNPGEYGEGDIFIGVRVPVVRKIARQFKDISIRNTLSLLHSPIHEERLLALIILVDKYRRGGIDEKRQVYDVYMSNLKFINNWDLVDSSARQIVGAHLFQRSRKPLYRLAGSMVLWDRRVSIMSTLYFIPRGDFSDTLSIAGILLHDHEDLIHKAVGWMLREVGKVDRSAEEAFLRQHFHEMPRTMLRYAIEKFPESLRQEYLKGTI